MDPGKLSVIIPNYNNAGFLSQCLDSVLSQTYQDFEIVIANDCSTDNSAEIIKEYASRHENIKTIFNTSRMNVSRNRQLAIEASKGEYLTTLDSDDFYYSEQKLEFELKMINFYKDTMNLDVCAFSNIFVVDENSRFLYQQWPDSAINEGDIFPGIFTRTCMIPRDFIVSRKLFDQAGGYDPQFNLYEDWDLKIRLSRIAPFYYSGITGVAYRRKGSGLSYVPVKQHVDTINKIWGKNKSIIQKGEEEFITSHLLSHLDFIKKNQS